MTFKTPAGGVIDLTKYRGKVVSLEFLLTTCQHCQLCSRIMQKLQTEYGPKGFQALGVAVNDMNLVPRYVLDLKLQFPVGFGGGDEAGRFLQHPPTELMRFPQLAFIDKRGIIRSQHLGCKEDDEKDFRARIEELLKEKPGPTKRQVVGRP
jgi:thiol-disulfide isomerase/thioredoxin